MESMYLREFTVLAETGNFQKAADELFISQPTLTRHIMLLEKELGAKVFHRTTRKIQLSEYGEYLLPYAKEITRLEAEYTNHIRKRVADAREVLTIGSIPAMSTYNITELFVEFNMANPSCSINVIEDYTPVLIRYLQEGKCDFAFLRSDNSPDEFRKIPITQDEMVALFPSDHPFANENLITVEQLKNENLLLLQGDLLYKRLFDDSDKEAMRPRVSFSGTRVENVVDMVGKGMGVTLVLKSSMRSFLNHNVSVVEITPSLIMDISLTYISSKELNPVEIRFMKMVRQWASRELQKSDAT